MARRGVKLHSEAMAEASAAVQWYRKRSTSAADEFLSELDMAIERSSLTPEIGSLYIAGTRRFVLRHFPFSIMYGASAEQIEVVSIAHGRRKPEYWHNRLT